MKILFTADIHIKLGQKNVPVDWARNRYRLLFEDYLRLQDDADVFVIGGDIFDRLATMEELELYFEMLSYITVPTIIYSGNHEANKKNTTWLSNLKNVTTKVNPKVKIIDDFHTEWGIDFIPYNKLKETYPSFNSEILCTHVRGEIPPHVKPEVNLELFSRWKAVLAGDLHSNENSQLNIIYPGSPVSTSFHRNPVDCGIIIYDTSNHTYEFKSLDLPQLVRKTVSNPADMLPGSYDHIIYELEGSMTDLAEVGNSDILDKKVIQRQQDTALILEPKMTLVEETKEYLSYVLELDDNTIEDVIQEFNDHTAHLPLS